MSSAISDWITVFAVNLSTTFGAELSWFAASCLYAFFLAVPFLVAGFLLRFFLRLFGG